MGHLGFEYNRLFCLYQEELHGFGAVTLAPFGFGRGKMLDVDKLVELPIGEQADGLFLFCLYKQAMEQRVAVGVGPLAVVVASLVFRESLVKQPLYK